MIFLKSQISKKLKIVAIVAIFGSPLEEMVATIFWTFKIVAIEYLDESLAMKSIKKIVAILSSPLGETMATIFKKS